MGSLSFDVPDTELSLTLHNRRAEVIDQIFRGTPFLNMLRQKGAVKTVDGGLQYVQPIRVSRNTTAGSFAGYDVLDTTPQENESSLVFDWAQMYATITISWVEQIKNRGRHQIINILNQKTDDAIDSLKDSFNTKLLQAETVAGLKDPISLQELLDTTPSTDPTLGASRIGNVSGASFSFWRNKIKDGETSFAVSEMNTLYHDVSDGADFPTMILSHQTAYEAYENSLTDQIRYLDTKVADAGIPNLLYKAIPIFWDPNLSVNRMYFINTKYLELIIQAGADFITTDFVTPDNQAAKTAKILWMGQLCVSNRRRQGVYFNIG